MIQLEATSDHTQPRLDRQHGDYTLVDLRDSQEWQLGDCPFVLRYQGKTLGEYPYLDDARADFLRAVREGWS